MQQVLDKLNFQITLQSEDVIESSPYWQRQCHILYDSIKKNLSEGSIDTLSRKSKEGEKAGIILSYDTLALTGITLNSFYVLIKLINIWERNRKKASIKLRSPNGSEFILLNLSVDEALEIYEKMKQECNPQE